MASLSLGSLHASAVAISKKAVLILGASGSGKSSLALELIGMGAKLISDDLVVLTKKGGTVYAERPPNAPEAIEVRGMGLLNCPTLGSVPLSLVVDLEKREEMRLPTPKSLEVDGIVIDLVYGNHISGLAQGINLLVQNGRFA